MARKTALFGAAVVGLAIASQASAQTTGSSAGQTTSGTSSSATSTGGVVNQRPDPITTTTGGSNLIQLKDLLNFKIQAQDGAFGRVSDLVFDRNGNVQYILGSHQGQTFALPFMASTFSGAPNTLTFNVPMASLEQLRIDANNLPSLQNQAFVSRMREIFGPTFGAGQNLAAYPPMNNQTGTGSGAGTTGSGAGTTGAGTTGNTTTTGSGSTGAGGTGSTGTAGSGTGTAGAGTTSGTGTPGRAGQNNDNWNWPANPAGIVPGTGNGRFTTPPGTPRGRAMDNRTGTGAGSRTGTGARTGAGASGSGTGTGTGAGTTGTGAGASGSGTSGSGTSGSGTSGSGSTGSGSTGS